MRTWLACTQACMHGLIHLQIYTHYIEISNTIKMIPQTPQNVTKWLSYERVHTRIKCSCTLTCMNGFIQLHRHICHIELSNMMQMMPQTLQMVTKWLSYNHVHSRINRTCTLACMHGSISLHRQTHQMELSNMIQMTHQTPQTVTKRLSNEPVHNRI